MLDAVLGPHVPGRDPLLDALNTFVGTPGSPAMRAWEQGLPNPTDPAGQLAGSVFVCSIACCLLFLASLIPHLAVWWQTWGSSLHLAWLPNVVVELRGLLLHLLKVWSHNTGFCIAMPVSSMTGECHEIMVALNMTAAQSNDT